MNYISIYLNFCLDKGDHLNKSIQKIIFLSLQNAAKKWTMPIKDWSLALNQFEILCGDFKYDLLENKK
ncbi:hypothetical protein [Rickettsia endosymbiont of Oedothorax gibbosus]|uniref:hypothetical protein n=1 Tax=Rickettsia endosymbiont of Oedothorax gibbosus TaxID=931099 RepID=UPI002023E646|nr:hypothetical protein [Rickettsia endosymbiont of Oedothorax gibbosus]